MFSYFKELEEPDNFKIFLPNILEQEKKHYIANLFPSSELILSYQELFARLKVIDSLLLGKEEENRIYRYFQETGEYIESPKEDYSYASIEEIKKKININLMDLLELFRFYYNHIGYYIVALPNLNSFWEETKFLLENAISEIRKKISIVIPTNVTGEYTYPNAWYITPNGYLYNTGTGHKEGSLVYSYQDIYDSVDGYSDFKFLTPKESTGIPFKGGKITSMNHSEKIREILKNGYVSSSDFAYYSNITCHFPNLLETNQNVFYQRNIITLVVGYLSARDSLYQSYARLNGSKRIKELVMKIGEYTDGDLADILVRFAHFSKVESTAKNMITTSSLDIEKYKLYLNRGWTLRIVPGIIYDAYLDGVSVMDFDSPFISKHIEEKIETYKGKGKILIR